MWKNKIKHKKIQFIFTGMILMVSSFILTISLSFTKEVNNYTNQYYEGKNIKDILVHTYNPNVITKTKEFLEKNEPNEKDIRETKALKVDRQVFSGNKNLDLGIANLAVYNNEKDHPWDVIITEGERTKSPKEGTIWISNILADTKNLKIGDKLKIKDGDKYKYLIISAFVNDSTSPSSVVSYYNFFINEKDYDKFDNLVPSYYIGYNSSKKGAQATSQLSSYLGGSIDGSIDDKWTTIYAATFTSTISSAIGISVALLVFIASILIIRFILWSNILKEYKSIGVYKSLGFSSKKIKNIYLKSFGVVGISGIVLGSFFSIMCLNYLVKISVKYIGVFNGGISNFFFMALIIITMSIVYIWTICLLLKRINKIKPVEALRIGSTSSKEKFKESIIKDASSPISIAINDIFKYKKQNFIILTVLALVVYLSVFLVSINYSITNIKYNYGNVFGLMQGDLVIDFSSGNKSYYDILADLKKDSRVLEVREGSLDVGKVVYLDSDKYNLGNSYAIAILSESFENDNGFKTSIIEGRNPKNKNEIAINKRILEDANLVVGDYMDLKILGEEKRMLITGSYGGMLSAEYNVRVKLDVVPEDMVYTLNNLNINVILKDKDLIEEFKSDYMKKYDMSSIDVCSTLISTTSISVIEVVQPITAILITGILIFSIINIVNLILISNKDNRRNNAVLKSLGFSNNYILKRTLYRISILVVTSSLIGFVLNLLISKKIFSIAMMGIDILMIPYKLVILTILFIAILTIIVSIISMNSIRKISIVELMEE